MPQMMKTFVMKSVGKVDFMQKPVPDDPQPGDAIIKTTRALVCTSDTHTVAGAIGERQDLTLGHAAVGTVHKAGYGVRSVKEGERVAVNAITPCYKCVNCLRGVTSQCTEMLGAGNLPTSKMELLPNIFMSTMLKPISPASPTMFPMKPLSIRPT